MKHTLPVIAIIACGAFAGNMINIGLSYGVYWLGLPTNGFLQDFAIKFPLLLAPTAVTLMLAFLISGWLGFRNVTDEQVKSYWRRVFYCITATIVLTLAYHLPTNIAFIEQSIAQSNVLPRAMYLFVLIYGSFCIGFELHWR